MQNSRKPQLLVLAGGVALVVYILWLIGGAHHPLAYERKRYTNPDSKYQAVVYAIPALIAMPGQEDDPSGYVRVYDAQGKQICQHDFSAVSDILDLFRRNPDELNYANLICRRGE
ncbi:hypothetical protein [Anabaena sp. CA = ATCC 33047]|uniref:hypothetical protein n=1 Tax=Anabaena sp. (strain CA / ATCC 33047) TaxID=52271 RepID=UPI00082A46E9|nr:hypothetical protein [Anabaena sp. CA = ATCC 33047]